MHTPIPRTKSHAKKIHKEVVSDKELQIESMMESPRDKDNSPFQHHEEVPPAINMTDLPKNHEDEAAEDTLK